MSESKIKTYNLDKLILIPKKLKLHTLDTAPLTPMEIIYLFFSYVIIILWAVIVVFPVTSLVISAFNVYNERYVAIAPFEFGWNNFEYLVNSPRSHYGRWYLNTVLIAISTMLLSVCFVALNGYAYSRFKFAGSKHSLRIVMLIQMLPATASLISFLVLSKIGRELVGLDPRVLLVIIYSGGSIAGNTFVLKGYLDTISSELDDSAKIDGCGNWRLFYKILMPIAKPMLAIIALWSFLGPFGDVILPKFLIYDLRQQTLASGLDTFLNTEPKHINAGAYAAGALLAAIPPFILFMYSQRHIVGGLSKGAMKG